MATCESCNKTGLDPRTMVTGKDPNSERLLLVGPCCTLRAPMPPPPVEYGIELSSNYGFLAYAKFGGLKMEYRKTPDELQKMFGGRQAQPTEAQQQELFTNLPAARA